MYLDHFGFKEFPFSIAPDPRYLYMSERHREALAHLLYGVRNEGGFVLLTGEVGTGKTTTCRCLLEQMPEDTETALVLNPKLTTLELLATFCDELQIPYPEGNSSIKLFIDRINARLLESFARGRRTVLIIDEAQNLDNEVLEQIRLLTNLETNERKLLQIILLGQPELRTRLAGEDLRQLAQRITARYHLPPLSRRETLVYIEHRLQVAGVRRLLFSSRAISRIYRLSGGIPRRINVLCDRALLGAYVGNKEKVSGRTVSLAAKEVFHDEGAYGPGIFLRWGIAALICLGVGISLAAFPGRLAPPPDVPLSAETFSDPPPSGQVEPMIVRQSISPPPVQSLDWDTSWSAVRSRSASYEELFRMWNSVFDTDNPACRQAEELGLSCLSRRDGLESLQRFNLPAVLTLVSHSGEEFHALLTGIADGKALFYIEGTTYLTTLEELQMRWYGDYTLLWRKPPFEGVVRAGDRGEGVRWVAERLALADGTSFSSQEDEPVLEGELLARLKRFQFSNGLAPDGIVGPLTVIHLEAAVGDGPRLRTTREVM